MIKSKQQSNTMSREYQGFRRRILDDLNAEMPGLGYKQKLRIVSEKWKQYKVSQVNAMETDEIINTFVLGRGEDDEGDLRRLRLTIELEGEAGFLKLQPGGENLLLRLLRAFMENRPPGDRFLTAFVRRFVAIGEPFYALRWRGFDIVDLVNFYQRTDLVYHVIVNAPRGALPLDYPSKLSCTLGLLFTLLRSERELRMPILDFAQRIIHGGVDPNLEIGDVICGADVHVVYEETDGTYREIRSRGYDKTLFCQRGFVHYVGIGDVGRDYRVFLRDVGGNSHVDTSSLELVGETLFSVFLHYAKHFKHRLFCEEVIKGGLLNLTTVVVQRGLLTTSYQSMVFRKSPRMIAQLSARLIKTTPAHFFFLQSADRPLQTLMEAINTSWEFLVLMNGGLSEALQHIFENRLIRPTECTLRHAVMQTSFLNRLIRTFSSFHPQQLYHSDPSATCLMKLCLEGPGLEIVNREFTSGNTQNWQRAFDEDVLKQLAIARLDDIKRYTQVTKTSTPDIRTVKNDTFVFSGLEVTGELLDDPSMTFITDDGFVFHRDEFSHLVANPQNPFNRRSLAEKELAAVTHLSETFDEWWFLYPNIPDLPTPLCHQLGGPEGVGPDKRIRTVVKFIDDFIDMCPFFTYGERLSTHYEGLFVGIDTLRATYMYLFSNPSVCIRGNLADGFENSCLGFRTHPSDHHSIEEINIYFGIRISQIFSETPPPLESAVENFLSWVYLILDSTRKYADPQAFNGRIITLYFVIANFLREII